MTLYSLRTDGDQHRITKFVDGEVESSYLCTHSECECPAGHRHTCRHRQMLPTMLAHGLADSMWFFDYDAGGRIVDFNGTSKQLLDQLAEPTGTQEDEDTSSPGPNLTATEIDERTPPPLREPLLEHFIDHVHELVVKPAAKPWRRL